MTVPSECLKCSCEKFKIAAAPHMQSQLVDILNYNKETRQMPDSEKQIVWNHHIYIQKDQIKSSSHIVEKNVYEGGFSIWECTFDLLQFLNQAIAHHDSQNFYLSSFDKLSVLDLGCGQGLVGIFALKLKARHVLFQDLNPQVLLQSTAPNIFYNFLAPDNGPILSSTPNIEAELQFTHDKSWLAKLDINQLEGRCHLLCCHWNHLIEEQKKCHVAKQTVDLLLCSEALYEPENYGLIKSILESCLAPTGYALFATKRFYFGVGGGTLQFKEFMETSYNTKPMTARNSVWKVKIVHTIIATHGNIRDILEVTRS